MTQEAHELLHPSEQRIMDLWDAGWTIERIGPEVSLPRWRVARTVGVFHADGESREARRRIVSGSALLAAAIREARNVNGV